MAHGQTLRQRRIVDGAFIGVAAILTFFMVLPFLWLFSMSFRPAPEAYNLPPSFLPPTFDFQNYRAVIDSDLPFFRMYWNSLKIAVIVTIGQLVTCSLAAFAFSRLRFPGRDSLFFVMLIGLMFPAQVIIIPLYLGFAQVGLIDSHWSLILMYLTSSFGVFLIRQFMLSQPKELEEAAIVDGAGYLRIFFRISLPQLTPALSALAIIKFTQTWNYYFQARVLLETDRQMTLPVGLDVLRGYLQSGNLSIVMAAMAMAIAPVILVFLLAQRYIVEGMTMTGIKK